MTDPLTRLGPLSFSLQWAGGKRGRTSTSQERIMMGQYVLRSLQRCTPVPRLLRSGLDQSVFSEERYLPVTLQALAYCVSEHNFTLS